MGIDLSQYSDGDLREKAHYNAVRQVLKYGGRDELPERLPRILELFVQILDKPYGIDFPKAGLVYLPNVIDKLSGNQLTDALHRAFIAALTSKIECVSPMPAIAEQRKQKGREEGLRAGISVMLKIRFPEETGSLGDQISELHSTELMTEFLDR